MWQILPAKRLSLPIKSGIFASFLEPKRLAFLEACLIGLVSGLVAVLLKQGVGWLGGWRVRGSLMLPAGLLLPLVGLIGGYIAGALVERLAPETSGSGLPQVKAALARFPTALNLRVAIVKSLSTMLVLASGLTLGRQGPTVQVGAALAGWLSRWVPTAPDYRRQIIASGAAAGLAAGFNAPIAGVLFVVEELLQDVSSLTLGTAILASFIGAVVARVLGGQNWDLSLTSTTSQASFSAPEIPSLLLLGMLAGVLGGLFCRGIVQSIRLNQRWLGGMSLATRIALAGLVSGIVMSLLPEAFRDNTGLREFLMAGNASIPIIAIALVAKFFLTLVAYGSGAPGGLFAPTLILGSALGSLVGLFSSTLLGVGDTATYALAGMGAFFSAVAKVPITAIVIIFEMTMDFNLVLPLMIASVVSYLVAEQVSSGSLYDRLLALKGINLHAQEKEKQQPLSELTAAEVMQHRVETLSSELSVDRVLKAFARSHHRGFPVVEDGKLVGIVTQADLAEITQRSLPPNATLRDIMTPQPLAIAPTDSLNHVLYLLRRYRLSRLPVTEGRKLVGIITRSDIIRAESDRLTGQVAGRTTARPSYAVYQTRSPATGQGRLLVPLANPQTAPTLLRMAAAIARDRDYEIECLYVCTTARHQSPAETPVNVEPILPLLQQGDRIGKTWGIPIHTQIRVGHDIAETILETIQQRHVNLLLMGWKGSTLTPGRIFGDAVDTLIRQADCEMVLVKWGKINPSKLQSQPRHHRKGKPTQEVPQNYDCPLPLYNSWLLPIGGGPNSQCAVQLLPSLLALSSTPSVRLTQVFDPGGTNWDRTPLDKAKRYLRDRLKCPIAATPIHSFSVPEAVRELVREYDYDVVMLGASREGLLYQAIKGNIPNAIARGCDCTTILVRSAIARVGDEERGG
jgi:CIC family chloride channel protein